MRKYMVVAVLILSVIFVLNIKYIYRFVEYNILVDSSGGWLQRPPRSLHDYSNDFLIRENGLVQENGVTFCNDFLDECRNYLREMLSAGQVRKANCSDIYRPKFAKYQKTCGPNGSILYITSNNIECSRPVVIFLHGRGSEPEVLRSENSSADYHNAVLQSFEQHGIQYIAPLVNAHTSVFYTTSFKGSLQVDIENTIYLAKSLCTNFADLTIAGVSYGAHLSELLYVGFRSDLDIKMLISVAGMLRRAPPHGQISFVNDSPVPRELLYAGAFDEVFACGNVLFVNGIYDKNPADVARNVEDLKSLRKSKCPDSRLEFLIFDGFHEVPAKSLATFLASK